MNRFFIFGLVLSLLNCAPKPTEAPLNEIQELDNVEGIINGSPVNTSQSFGKSTIALYFMLGGPNNTGKVASFCSGTLITKNVVISAAHCFADTAESLGVSVDEFARYVRVGFGLKVATDLNDPAVEFHVVKAVRVHPLYIANSVDTATSVPMDDLSLIRFEGVAPATAQSAKLVANPSLIQRGTQLILSGYGLTDSFNKIAAKRLMYTTVNVDNPAITSAQFTYIVKAGRSACSGDSGGPAYLPSKDGYNYLVGVTSWGDNFCQQMGAYTSIPKFIPWIKEAVAAL